ncbi:multiheme c-type cytochrome [Thermosulfurimonas sp.]|uniref:multiheme c-type cytochrome n=1 Tax=Thermosulfurimonas sp. TaxID=2080236 RepID=UPI0025CD3D02|nr:multiheme c-type cytochrome [Thermosulfurimonas sp.]
MRWKVFWSGLVALLLLGLGGPAGAVTQFSKDVTNPKVRELNKKCMMCHLKENKSLVFQWQESPHAAAKEGPVGCYTCHAANPGDPLGYKHEGAFIKTLITPKDCSYCHPREFKEFENSHHATAGQIMASLDNLLGEVVCSAPAEAVKKWGLPAYAAKADAQNACWQCHGSVVKVLRDKKGNIIRTKEGAPRFDPSTWPNSGMGRINPDGTKGACNACHSKHAFRASVARQPFACGKCHLGPDHPQKEIYEESKHGIAYLSAVREKGLMGMNILKTGSWVLGKDYYFAPTCSTCHMGAYMKPNGSIARNTHNVGDRISWNLRPPISVHLNRVITTDGKVYDVPGDIPPLPGQFVQVYDYMRKGNKLVKVKRKKQVQKVISWKERRAAMKEVCKSCHSMQQVENFYEQFDALVVTYNEKFAKPAKRIFQELVKDGLVPKSPFMSKVGWIWFEIWHHEGRRARHGAAMLGPDYTHWHGLYEVAKHFYYEYIPEVLKVAKEHGKLQKYQKLIRDILSTPEHSWRLKGFGAQMKAIEEEYKERYGKGGA